MRARVLLTDLHPERGLSRTLRSHLDAALPEFEFSLTESGPLDAIWVCGYEPHQIERVRELRARHPEAVLLVTAAAGASGWEAAVRDAGADHALAWPCSMSSLGSLLVRSNGASAN